MSLELSEFVRETIVQIAQGLSEASEPVEKLGGAVNPLEHKNMGSRGIKETAIEFSLEIGAQTNKSASGKAKIAVFGQGMTADGEMSKASRSENRVNFTIYAQLPSSQPTANTDYSL